MNLFSRKVGRPRKYKPTKPMAIQLDIGLPINPRAKKQTDSGRPSEHTWPLLSSRNHGHHAIIHYRESSKSHTAMAIQELNYWKIDTYTTGYKKQVRALQRKISDMLCEPSQPEDEFTQRMLVNVFANSRK